MKKPLIFLGVALVLLVGTGGLLLASRMMKARAALAKPKDVVTVAKGEIVVKVIESGTIDAVKSVEVRSRASGRLSQLYVDDGDLVGAQQLVAVIDPQETEFRVRQDRAQLSGAASGVARTELEIQQQRIQLHAAYLQAQKRLALLKEELKVQPTMTKSSIDEAAARLVSAKSQRDTLVAVTHPNQRVDVERALADAKSSVENSRREYARQQDLVKKGYVPGRSGETARLQLDLDESRLRVATSNSDRLERQQRLEISRADEDVRAAEAAYNRSVAGRVQDEVKRKEVEQAELELQRAKASLLQVPILQRSRDQSAASVTQLQSVLDDSLRQLRETQVRAPFAGIVSKRYIEVGDLVTALSSFSAGTAILRIEDRSQMRVRLEMNEIDVARIREGMEAKIEIDALPGKQLKGRISKIAPSSSGLTQASAAGGSVASDSVVKYTVEIILGRSDSQIRTGMTAKCSLDVVNKQGVLRIPIAYLGNDKEGAFVMIAPNQKAKNGKGTRRKITAGVNTGAWVEVSSGLKLGEKLVRPDYTGPKRTGFISSDDGG